MAKTAMIDLGSSSSLRLLGAKNSKWLSQMRPEVDQRWRRRKRPRLLAAPQVTRPAPVDLSRRPSEAFSTPNPLAKRTNCNSGHGHGQPLVSLVLFQLLLVASLPIVFQTGGQFGASGGLHGPDSHRGQPQPQRHSRLVANMEPAAGSIFGSLLGTSNNNGNSAAHQQQQQQQQQQQLQSAADLHQSYKMGQTSDKVTLPGDILLGGLFPIHMKGTKVECGEINRDRGIQRLEAMLYALDRINEDSEILPEIKLGAILLDSCSSSTYALNQSLEFIRASINTVESSAFECKDKSTPRPKYGSKMIAGVIGGSYSEVSLQVANLLRLFRIPQVSYASTGTALSDKSLYDLFARTVPSDMFQARAIADIVLKLNWSYVSLVSSEGLYGDSGSKEFMKQASVRRICIATHEKVSPTTDELAYDIIVANLLKRNATGVVLFTRAEDTKELLKAVKRAGLFHNFAWVAADGWGTHQKLIEGVEEVAWGAITVELQAKAIPGFDQYMKALTPWGNLRNPWFSEYWQEWFNCQLQANLVQQQQVASGAYSASRREPPPDYGPPAGSGPAQLTAAPASGSGGSAEPQEYEFRMRRRSLPDGHPGSSSARRCPTKGDPEQRNNSSGPMDGACAKRTAATSNTTAAAGAPLSRPKRMLPAASLGAPGQAEMRPKQFCSPNLRISESNSYRQEQKVQFVVDAVYAMAHALHKAWYQLCDARPGVVCEALKELNGGEFYSKYLLNVSFKDLAGSEVKFDEHGDGLGRYNIYNYRQVKPQITASNSFTRTAGPRLQTPTTGSSANDSSPPIDGGSISDGLAIDELEGSDSLADKLGGVQGESLDGILTGGQQQQQQASSSSPAGGQQPDADQPLGGKNGADQEESIFTSDVRFEYSAIGRWDENEYHLRLEDIEFIQGDRLIPESYCSRPCELGQAKIMRAGDHCCWICKTCAPYEYLPDEFSCRDCGIGRWPVPNKTSCYDLPQKYLRWDSVYSLMSLTIACLGIALTLFVTVIFIKYLDTPVVKASGRELSFILLTGIGFCHTTTFVLLSKPTPFICGSQRFLVNFGFALMYASLLVKTNRISRIFNCARKSAKRPSFISPKSQMLITGILVAIQIFLTIVWFAFEPPGIRADSPEGKRDEVILKCRAKGKSFILSLVYNMILITTCTIYAVKTRKIPENFNESKFIGFTMYTTIVIWLAFVTMFFGTNNSYEIQMNTMCVCISLSAYVTLFCLFSPKLSIILLHPDKNVRKLTMNSATYKRPFKPVSSFASADGRNNTMGAAYNGAQTDGGSGPMSTTSNVLNLAAESQAARLMESSIVSNVVNSNSAGSNCSNSQKTPTTLSQQLTLVSACANCGAHQLAQVPQVTSSSGGGAAAAGSGSGASGQSNGAGKQGPAGGSSAGQKQAGGPGYASTSSAMDQHHQPASIRPPAVSMSRSAILVSSSPVGSKQGGTKAKVLHSKILAQQDPSTTGSTPTSATLKRMSSDEHLLAGAGSGRQRDLSATVIQSNIPPNSNNRSFSPSSHHGGLGSNKSQRHPASLSRLNELNSTTSSDRHGYFIDESISSLANDSLVNTSQENTPCNVAGSCHGHQHGRTVAATGAAARGDYHRSKLGSDSMLWNQSVYSIDYCSDCCPSYCHCSCPACSLSNGGDEAPGGGGNGALSDTGQANTISLHATGSHHDTELEDYDPMLDCSLMVQEMDCGPSASQMLLQQQQQQFNSSGFVIRRRKSEEPGRGSGCYYFGAGGQSGSTRPAQQETVAEQEQQMDDSGSMGRARRSQTMEMRTVNSGEKSSSSGQQLSGPGKSVNQQAITMEAAPASQNKAHHPQQKSSSITSSQPVVYALQAAATSALGGCAASQVVTSLESHTATSGAQQDDHQHHHHHYIQFTSNKDKNSERNQQQSNRLGDSFGSKQQAASQSTSRHKQPAEPAKGAIQASIELIRTTSQKRNAEARRQHRESSCFSGSYHDDYEYNYGLVQSNSDSENYCCADDDSGGSMPKNEADPDTGQRATKLASGRANEAYRPQANDDLDDDEDEEEEDVLRDVGFDDDDGDGDGEDDDDCEDGDDNRDDDFEHDGRLMLTRQRSSSCSRTKQQDKHRKRTRRSSIKSHTARSGSGSNSRRSQISTKLDHPQLQIDDHRINSVALIAATLSAGGAIVESGGASDGRLQGFQAPLPAADKSLPSASSTGQQKRQQQQQQHEQDFQAQTNATSSSSSSATTGSGAMEQSSGGEGHISCLTTL